MSTTPDTLITVCGNGPDDDIIEGAPQSVRLSDEAGRGLRRGLARGPRGLKCVEAGT